MEEKYSRELIDKMTWEELNRLSNWDPHEFYREGGKKEDIYQVVNGYKTGEEVGFSYLRPPVDFSDEEIAWIEKRGVNYFQLIKVALGIWCGQFLCSVFLILRADTSELVFLSIVGGITLVTVVIIIYMFMKNLFLDSTPYPKKKRD